MDYQEVLAKGFARQFSVVYFLRTLFVHLFVGLLGPFAIVVLLVLRVETCASLKNKNMLGTLPRVVVEWSPFFAFVALSVLFWQTRAIFSELVMLCVVCFERSVIVSVKYGYYSTFLRQQLRTSTDPVFHNIVHLIPAWLCLSHAALHVELQKAFSGSLDSKCEMRTLQAPWWVQNADCDHWDATLDEVTKAVLSDRELPRGISRLGTEIYGEVCYLSPERFVELLFVVVNAVFRESYAMHRRPHFWRLYMSRIVAIFVSCSPMVAKVVFHNRLDIRVCSWYDVPIVLSCCLVLGLVTGFMVQINLMHVTTAVIDLQRRCAMQLAFCDTLGIPVMNHVPMNGDIVKSKQASAGLLFDLSDGRTVVGLQIVSRAMRRLGFGWCRRAEMFLSVVLFEVVWFAAAAWFWAFGPKSTIATRLVTAIVGTGNLVEFHVITIPVLFVYTAVALWLVIQAIEMGSTLNRLEESHVPLALHTARIGLNTVHDRFADTGLASMASHMQALQVVSPTAVLGVSSSTSLLRIVQGIVLFVLTTVVKIYVGFLDKNR